jgi:predicted nucleic acid-binding protein
VFDTSAIIDFLRGGGESRSIVEATERRAERIYVTVISKYELLTPIYHKLLREEERNVRTFLRRSTILPLEQDSAEESSKIMGELFKLGIPVNALDTLIAGISVVSGVDTIVTKDKDFERISEIANIKILLIS